MQKYTRDSIQLYIFNWKKVNENSIKLYNNAIKHIKNVKIINCDENYKFDKHINRIELNDSYYYGGQYNTAIKDVGSDKILGIIVGDTVDVNFEQLFINMLDTFNTYDTGIYTINDKRSPHKKILGTVNEAKKLKLVLNTDCGIWFINPLIHQRLKNIDYHTMSHLGWGIDIITIKECNKQKKLVIRDYSLECDQIDHTMNYNGREATKQMNKLFDYYNNNFC